jgi:hypothetical protein
MANLSKWFVKNVPNFNFCPWLWVKLPKIVGKTHFLFPVLPILLGNFVKIYFSQYGGVEIMHQRYMVGNEEIFTHLVEFNLLVVG